MNFEAYKTWRDQVLETHNVPSENRFDCLNPFKAMDFVSNWGVGYERDRSFEFETARDKWKKLHFQSTSSEGLHLEATRGVRAALGSLFERMEGEGMELWLPADVYPFYKQEVETRAPRLVVRYFKTLPTVDFTELTTSSRKAVLLITDPLTPTGRYLSEQERRDLKRWSNASKDRWAIFDSVYHYHWQVPRHFVRDMLESRFIHLFSMSKSYLLRGVFGFAIGADANAGWWTNLDLAPSVEAEDAAKAALYTDPFMPDNQERIFQSEWLRRGHKLKKYGPVYPRAGSGYFRRIDINFEKAFADDGLLLVPASVFGSTEDNTSIATCLYEASLSRKNHQPR